MNDNISPPPGQLKSSCASTKLPNQDDAALRFPMDDFTTPMTSIELHVPRGNDTIKVTFGVFTPLDYQDTKNLWGTNIT
jgi:hypothetical protein